MSIITNNNTGLIQTKEQWLEAWEVCLAFENCSQRTVKVLNDYLSYINNVVKSTGYQYSTCTSCSGTINKAHSDFQVLLNRWALENDPSLLTESPKLTAPYDNEFWSTNIKLASFHVLANMYTRITSDLVNAVRRGASTVDALTASGTDLRTYISAKRNGVLQPQYTYSEVLSLSTDEVLTTSEQENNPLNEQPDEEANTNQGGSEAITTEGTEGDGSRLSKRKNSKKA